MIFGYNEYFPRAVVSVIVIVSSFVYHWKDLSKDKLKDSLNDFKLKFKSGDKLHIGSLISGLSLFIWLVVMFFYDHEVSTFLVVLSLSLMVIAIFCYIVDSDFYTKYFSNTSIKFVVGFLFSCLIFYSRYIAFLSINRITNLDPGLFPFAIVVMTTVVVFLIFTLINIFILVFSMIIIVVKFFKKTIVYSYVNMLFIFCVFIHSVVFGSSFLIFSYEHGESTLSEISNIQSYLVEYASKFHAMKVIELDMSSDYPCNNKLPTDLDGNKKPIIFIGNSLDYIAYEESGSFVISGCEFDG
ncbi:hypothetical protein V6243_00690 [Cobetia marina]|uniref:Uncharacterized protein n=1 Tax=Cobetia marina TaxID=28258 RepID=A0ABU9GEC9_COBMA